MMSCQCVCVCEHLCSLDTHPLFLVKHGTRTTVNIKLFNRKKCETTTALKNVFNLSDLFFLRKCLICIPIHSRNSSVSKMPWSTHARARARTHRPQRHASINASKRERRVSATPNPLVNLCPFILKRCSKTTCAKRANQQRPGHGPHRGQQSHREQCAARGQFAWWRDVLRESAGRTDDLKELGPGPNTLGQTEPLGRTTTLA